MKRRIRILFMVVWIWVPLLVWAGSTAGQEQESPELSLRLRRNFGYSLGAQMQGTFTLGVGGPEELVRVEFLLDGESIGEDRKAPFEYRLNTRDYREGIHKLSAVGTMSDGTQLHSETITRQFVATSAVTAIVIAVVVLVVAFRVGSYLLARRSNRGRSARPSYGFLGGAICPNCGQPFGLHWWSIRLGFGRFDRCPHCGKWHMVQRVSADSLAEAERSAGMADETDMGLVNSQREEELYRQRVDDSRFDQG